MSGQVKRGQRCLSLSPSWERVVPARRDSETGGALQGIDIPAKVSPLIPGPSPMTMLRMVPGEGGYYAVASVKSRHSNSSTMSLMVMSRRA